MLGDGGPFVSALAGHKERGFRCDEAVLVCLLGAHSKESLICTMVKDCKNGVLLLNCEGQESLAIKYIGGSFGPRG
jgi:hypothetical protein